MTSSRGEGPTRWVRRKASDRGIKQPPTLTAAGNLSAQTSRANRQYTDLYFPSDALQP